MMRCSTIVVALLAPLAHIAAQDANERALRLHQSLVETDASELRRIVPPPVPAEHQNPWSAAEERAFMQRVGQQLDAIANQRVRGNTYFENEKRWYGEAMLHFLATGEPRMLSLLQERDHQHAEWHRETAGIDYYACFTIKHQVRKYFQFGSGLDPQYLARMSRGAESWTEADPLRRPHYAHQPGKSGWGPDAKNSWVDVRTTDNLSWMRLTSVYLMAEETGNAETTRLYKDSIRRFVVALYRVGTGEWDSHNYLSHTIAPIHNLYDFAKDGEVRLLAKAALDHYYTAAAIKYRNGNWGGPNKRDYNAIAPMTASPAVFSVMFGGHAVLPKADYDVVHLAASAYRPPMAVLALARKTGLAGTEMRIAHAPYSAPSSGRFDVEPAYHETHFFGESFQLGSLARGTQEPDVNGFKILVDDPTTGAEMIQLVPGPDPLHVGSPQYQQGKLIGRSRVAQSRNRAIYLTRGEQTPWTLVLPNSTERLAEVGVLFLRHGGTWIALRPTGATIPRDDQKATERLRIRTKRVKLNKAQVAKPPEWVVPGSIEQDAKGRTWAKRREERHPDYRAISAVATAPNWSGFAIEVGDRSTHNDFDAFRQGVLDTPAPELDGLDQGVVSWPGGESRQSLEIRAEEPLSGSPVLIDGAVRRFTAPFTKYGSYDPETLPPVEQSWTEGRLTVRAGGHTFSCNVTTDGQVTFENR